MIIIIIIIAFLLPLLFLNTTNSYIKALENLDISYPEITSLSDLYELEEYKSDVIDYILISVFARIFEGFTGKTVLETLKGIHFFLSVIVLLEFCVIAVSIYYGIITS